MIIICALCIFIISAIGTILGGALNQDLTTTACAVFMALSAFVYFDNRIEELKKK